MNLTEQVYKKLRKAILNGELAPGTRLTEIQLAETYQISRTPIREALARLKNESLVYLAPGSGLVVSDTSIRDMEELMGIRRVLEEYALDQAFDHLTEVDLLQLELFVNQAKCLLKENDVKAIFEVNTKFHNYILEKSMNRRLQTILRNLMDTILRYRIATLHYPGNSQRAVERHEQLVAALKRRDKELALRLLREDVTVGKDIMEKLFQNENPEEVLHQA
jgi:DNA-binding GntR family transcriptional regulator